MSDFGKGANVPSKDIVYRQDVEDMLQNALPSRGMWEIEGDVAKNAICETVVDLMMDLEKLPSAQPEPREVVPHRNYQYLSDYWCECGWHLGKKGDVKYCPDCGRKVKWDG